MADPLTESIAARRAAEAELASHDALDAQAEREMRRLLARRDVLGTLTAEDAAALGAASARLAMTTAREDLAPGFCMAPIGHYVVFFRVLGEMVRVERVLHGARDLPAIFGQGVRQDARQSNVSRGRK